MPKRPLLLVSALISLTLSSAALADSIELEEAPDGAAADSAVYSVECFPTDSDAAWDVVDDVASDNDDLYDELADLLIAAPQDSAICVEEEADEERLVLSIHMGTGSGTGDVESSIGINRDGEINVLDVLQLLYCIVGTGSCDSNVRVVDSETDRRWDVRRAVDIPYRVSHHYGLTAELG